jgi:hypothetical protein
MTPSTDTVREAGELPLCDAVDVVRIMRSVEGDDMAQAEEVARVFNGLWLERLAARPSLDRDDLARVRPCPIALTAEQRAEIRASAEYAALLPHGDVTIALIVQSDLLALLSPGSE